MSAAAAKEEVGDGIGGRLRGKMQGVCEAGGEVALDGKGAEIGGRLGGGELTGELWDAVIELLGELEVTLIEGGRVRANGWLSGSRRWGVGQAGECGGQGGGDVGDAFVEGDDAIMVEVVEGLVVIDADVAEGTEESLGGGDGEDDGGAERFHEDAVAETIGLGATGEAEVCAIGDAGGAGVELKDVSVVLGDDIGFAAGIA